MVSCLPVSELHGCLCNDLLLANNNTDAVASIAKFGDDQSEDVRGMPPGTTNLFILTGIGTCLSSLLCCSPIILLGESIAGVLAGGRTGLAAVVTGLCYLACVPFSPIAKAVPLFASAPALMMVGVSNAAILFPDVAVIVGMESRLNSPGYRSTWIGKTIFLQFQHLLS